MHLDRYFALQIKKVSWLKNSLKDLIYKVYVFRIKLRTFRHYLHWPVRHLKKSPKPVNNHLLKPSFIIFFVTVGFLSTLVYFYVLRGLPHPQDLIENKPAVSTKIYDRQGRLLYKFYDHENRSIISLKDLPPYVIKATLAIEDSDFYSHAGFSLKGISRAFQKNIKQNQRQGGSTITQQLVKTTLLTPEKTYQRKIKELVLAIEVESYFTKDEILSMYFNQIPYGGPNYGIEEAAQYYFGKSVKNVDLAEAAMLAGLPAAPTVYSPFGTQPELAIARQHEVLRRMVQEGYVTQGDADHAKSEVLTLASPQNNIRAPHFVMYIKDKLVNKYGETTVTKGGMEVTTSLDLDIQDLAQYAINKELNNLKNLNVTNAAALVTNPKTGEVLAMVGSRDYFDVAHDGQVNVTLRPRQPGSSIKVITYTLGLESGLTSATIIDDSPITFKLPHTDPYTPKNYDGRYHGQVTLRQALANSYNIPAVKTLASLGVDRMVQKAKDMGITTWDDSSRFGLSLTLGGGEVKMVDMAVVFGTLANVGKRINLHPILHVTNFTNSVNDTFACDGSYKNTSAERNRSLSALAADEPCAGTQVVTPAVASLMSDILSDNQARSPAFGNHSLLEIPGHQVAVKTGTTNSLRDNWTIGYTQDYLVAVWVGNNDNTPMSRVASGITGATPIWNTIMTALLKDTAQSTVLPKDGLVSATICPLTGTLTCPQCPNPKTEYFAADSVPKTACNDALLAPYLKPPLTVEPQKPHYFTTYVEPTHPVPSPSRPTPPDFTSPFSRGFPPSKFTRPFR